MELLSKDLGVTYISMTNILCNVEGCLTRVGDRAEDLVTFDYGHLTKNASDYVVSKFPPF